ncbi:hypothetical protein [Dawidia soli]|uniref:Uncharacterized protein n=1 Tax=Dawidia soli TaxID=2782352 RepID=A0AAP2D6J2_9BACT|nr:hypothetical protein [Dawidia soli]MBT1686296.1 hypothetical protein [Dawidia soli]
MKTTTRDNDETSANHPGVSAEGQKKPAQDRASKEFEKGTSKAQPNKKPAGKRLGDESEIDDETTI